MTSQDNFAVRFAKHKDELDTLTVDKLEGILAFANKAASITTQPPRCNSGDAYIGRSRKTTEPATDL